MKTAKNTKTTPVTEPAKTGLSLNEIENIYAVLQGCVNNPGVQPATILYCRKVKKHALSHLQAYDENLKELMEEYKVPTKTTDGLSSYVWSGMKEEVLIAGLVKELSKQTCQIENLNALSMTECIKHTRGLTMEQMDIFEKYLVKAE